MYKSLHFKNRGIIIENYHNDFLLLKSDSKTDLIKLGQAIFEAKPEFVEEVITTEVEICLKLNALFQEHKLEFINQLNLEKNTARQTYFLPVFF